ncbi:MAG TPA: N-acetyltransferase [Spirochaetia bacterium]|nr:MAG: GNAT family N-acetyltransferase [Spirochaetes bacterium GWB1_36_13]HCL55492.1 N-acetyltransferase [Spirochaetia bacterium]
MVKIRKANLQDVKKIHALLQHFAKKGDLLGRPLSTLYERVREFFVAEDDHQELIACAALSIAWENLAEIRSLAVREDYHGKGIGRMLIENALLEAKALLITEIFTLTYQPDFFKKMGFGEIDKKELPHKIWSDCINCPYFPDCNEVSLIYKT